MPGLRRCLPLVLLSTIAVAPLRAASCAFDRALQLHQAGDYEAAMREYRACLETDPGRVEVRSNLGAVLAALGRYREAIDQYRQALNTAPPETAVRLRFNLALAYYKSFQIAEAASELETLHRLEPNEMNVALLLADCRLRMGEYKKAIALLQPFEAKDADQPAVDYVLGMAFIRDGQISEGQLRVDRILRRGDSPEGHLLLGVSFFAAGDYPGAVKELSKAVALNPALPSVQSYYGQALLFTGDADAAAEAFRKELASDPNDFDANFRLASILAARGRGAEARPLLERAVALRPGSAEAREALEHGFHFEKSAPGDPGIPVGSTAPPVGGLDLTRPPKPVALIFASYTCPKFRSSAEDLKRLAAQYREDVDFRLIYIREAHADGGPDAQWQSTINSREGIDLPPARTLAEKQAHAQLCVRKLALPFGVVVDGMDTAAEKAYQAWPSRVYLVDRQGRVVFNSRLGELDFHPAELDRAIRDLLPKKGLDARPR